MSFNFLPKNRTLEVLTIEEVNKLIENREAEYFFYKKGEEIFLLYENGVYFCTGESNKYFERIHKKEYLKILRGEK